MNLSEAIQVVRKARPDDLRRMIGDLDKQIAERELKIRGLGELADEAEAELHAIVMHVEERRKRQGKMYEEMAKEANERRAQMERELKEEYEQKRAEAERAAKGTVAGFKAMIEEARIRYREERKLVDEAMAERYVLLNEVKGQLAEIKGRL